MAPSPAVMIGQLLLLTGVSLLAGALMCTSAPTSYTAADLRSCSNGCCISTAGRTVRKWTRPSPAAQAVRVRQSLSTALNDPAFLAKYKRAYELLKSSGLWEEQRRLHCIYSDRNTINVHSNWYFFAWHRWYLYFHERILANLINDPTFALPAWDWDNARSKRILDPYKDTSSVLYVAARNPNPTSTQNLINSVTAGEQMSRTVYEASDSSSFFGGIYGSGTGGSVETSSHNLIHFAVGRQVSPWNEMGNLETAGNDPLFYTHHCNVDRLWWLWKRMDSNVPGSNGLPRAEPASGDYQNAVFVFVDYNGDLVEVRAGDATNTLDLEYTYADFSNDWASGISLKDPPKIASIPDPIPSNRPPPPPPKSPPPPRPMGTPPRPPRSPPPPKSPKPPKKRSPPRPPKSPPPPKKPKKTKKSTRSGRRLLERSDGIFLHPGLDRSPGLAMNAARFLYGRHLSQVPPTETAPTTTMPLADPAKTTNPVIPTNTPDSPPSESPGPNPVPGAPPSPSPPPGGADPAALVQQDIDLGSTPTTVSIVQVPTDERPGFKEQEGGGVGKRNEVILILQGFELTKQEPLMVNVFLDNPLANSKTPLTTEAGFVGTFVNVPFGTSPPVKRNLQFPLYSQLAERGKEDALALKITFVVTVPSTGEQVPDGVVLVDNVYCVYR